ncbi:MAG: SdpI family protein [Flavobacteriaceae bacterium]|nr:SdpI family protein [Flavobacteriaceae bacterium]
MPKLGLQSSFMESFNPLSLILCCGGLIFVIAGYIQQKFPPKKINHFYGYRTRKSMRDQESWDFAQAYSSRQMQKMGAGIVLLGGLAWLADIHSIWGIGIGIIIFVLCPLLMLVEIEQMLKKRFPKK